MLEAKILLRNYPNCFIYLILKNILKIDETEISVSL